MTNWITRRKASFIIHTAVVLIPFAFSTYSAGAFWYALFGSAWIAAPMVAVVDVLALLGLVLYIARIESPFVHLRHALPFISIVPLGLELYGLLSHNGTVVAGAVTALVSIVLVAVAWQCFTTIERLFIPPIEAAREKAQAQIGMINITLAQLRETENAVDGFVVERFRYHAPTVSVARPADQGPLAFGATEVQLATTKATPARAFECPKCGSEVSLGAYGAAMRHGHCKACKEATS